MLCSNAYVVSDDFFDYDGKSPTAHHDENGTGPLYRLYPAKEGWVFLAAPLPQRLGGPPRRHPSGERRRPRGGSTASASPEAREANAAVLAEALAEIFAGRTGGRMGGAARHRATSPASR